MTRRQDLTAIVTGRRLSTGRQAPVRQSSQALGLVTVAGQPGRSVILVVLGEYLACNEQTAGLEASLGDDAAVLLEQIRQDAAIPDRDRSRGLVADDEIDRHSVGLAPDRAVPDDAADAY